ncbi:hypothetical protein F5Y19DRAFT_471231 [Xylariaceae sp. FL1651]|nr:hypothetical protein F5Y19DRAFT_471231 [Xylariaceae sp. FL1651]
MTLWTMQAKLDFVTSMFFAVHGEKPVGRKNWEIAAEVMKAFGYDDVTWTQLNGRWSKVELKTLKQHNPKVFEAVKTKGTAQAAATVQASISTRASAPVAGPATTSKRRQKRKIVQEDDEDEDADKVVTKAPASKKQKKQEKE